MSDISENSGSSLTFVSAGEQPGFVTTRDPPKENAIARRQLFRAAAPWVGGVFGSAALGLDVPRVMAQVAATAEPPLAMGHPITKRWIEQRWVLDNIIQANGVDWDQPRSQYWNAACGIQAATDFARVRQRVKKYADISIEFEDVARRREKRAREAEAVGEVVSARENYFIAAIHWGAAQWPIDEANELNRQYNQSKRDCFGRYAKLADHHVEAVWIPFGSKALPAWFHLPVGYAGGRVPVVVTIPGMDSFKEAGVAMYGDSLLNRGFGVLAVDGPGEYESPLLGIYVTVENWEATGRACMEWLLSRPEVHPQCIGISGRSFGSFGATLAAANEPRFRAVAVSATCFEPGFHTIFEEASPTFKKRFMFMANIVDEAAFDEFAKKLTWEGQAEKIRMPFLCIAGGSDELSPIEDTMRLFYTMPGPRQLVIYEESRHSVGGGVSSAVLGPEVTALVANWLAARFTGQTFRSERWYVNNEGNITRSAI
jgi:pimeloyl-ACP methyl ester carboxylesterase